VPKKCIGSLRSICSYFVYGSSDRITHTYINVSPFEREKPEVDAEASLCFRSLFIKYIISSSILFFFFIFCKALSKLNALSINLGSRKAVFAIVSLNSRFTNLFAISTFYVLLSGLQINIYLE
jgi:hypothetical protein